MPNSLSLEGATPEDDRRGQLELAQNAVAALSRLHGALELHAAVLALLLPFGSKRAVRAWQLETQSTPDAQVLLEHVNHLPAAARLPWFETLVSRLRSQPSEARKNLLTATRRVMGARGVVRPIDRLHWLAMRQRLGGDVPIGVRAAAAAAELSQLPQDDVGAIAIYSAFLSRMVPVDTTAATPELETPTPADATAPGLAWYETVMAPWRHNATIPPCAPPDNDGLVNALQCLQTLPWMQRPVVARGWVTAAQKHSRHRRLGAGAADALRLSCSLLDSPLPPELAQFYDDATR